MSGSDFGAGVAELLVFHPVDTIAKRLMSNKTKVRARTRVVSSCAKLFQVSLSSLSSIIFREQATAPLAKRLLSLFPGLGYAAGYKVTQRIYKYGGQPYFNDIIKKNYATQFTNTFGERKGKLMMQASAGRYVHNVCLFLYTPLIVMFSLTGIGEVVSENALGTDLRTHSHPCPLPPP